MSSYFLKHYRIAYFLLPILLGLALAHLAATALGIYLTPPAQAPEDLVREQPAPLQKPALPDYQAIVQRNIFDSTARPAAALTLEAEEQEEPVRAAPVARAELTLVGTVTRGDQSLAVIQSGREIETYTLGDEVPGGGTLEEVSRNQASIRYADGGVQVLTLQEEAGPNRAAAAPTARSARAPRSAATAAAPGNQIREVGENRYVIPARVAEEARGNIGELLKQARLEPNVVNGQTQGFEVKMIQPRSLLAQLGIQRGDVVMQVNGVEMDSPEKALQIFQQLREARNITIGVLRGGNNLNFEYEVN